MCDGAVESGTVWTKAGVEVLCIVAMDLVEFERAKGKEERKGGMKEVLIGKMTSIRCKGTSAFAGSGGVSVGLRGKCAGSRDAYKQWSSGGEMVQSGVWTA